VIPSRLTAHLGTERLPTLGADMRRREFLSLLVGAAVWPRSARAQFTSNTFRVGFLGPPLSGSGQTREAFPHFLAELREFGLSEGRNLVIDARRIDRGVARAFAEANELFAAKSYVLFAFGPELALQAAAAARPAVPIVIGAINYDPIASGYVKSLANPGGSVTGVVSRQLELSVKQLELLAEAFPDRKRVGILWDAQSADQYGAAARAAPSMGLSLASYKFEKQPYDFVAGFQTLTRDNASMLMVLSSPLFSPHNNLIAELAIQYRLPSIFIFRHYVAAGGLMSYGVDFPRILRRAGTFVGKILLGAKPAELPVEQVTHFEFVVNLKTAKALGIALPTSILLRANEVIE